MTWTEAWWLIKESATTVIAICAFFLSIYQAYATRKHNRLSVKPHLTSFTRRTLDLTVNPGHGKIDFSLVNNGLGPAIINDFKVTLDDDAIPLENTQRCAELVAQLVSGKMKNFTRSDLTGGYAMRKDESKEILVLDLAARTQDEFDKLSAPLDRLKLIVKYESIYGDKFEFRSDGVTK